MSQAEQTVQLDEIMLAMDVVDTLRHQEELVQRELKGPEREAELLARLKRIYEQQGIDVSEQALLQGIKALEEDRFTYYRGASGLGRWLATVYVNRRRWLPLTIALVVVALLSWAVYFGSVTVPNRQLPATIERLYDTGLGLAETIEATHEVESLFRAGIAAYTSNDIAGAKEAAGALESTNAVLRQAYSLRIVNEPNADTGVWRIPDVNQQARNYYIIVEALDDTGRSVKVPVLNEESGKVENVSRWGMRVSAGTWNQVAADKQDDGIIQNNEFGVKRFGALEPEYFFPTTGGSITKW